MIEKDKLNSGLFIGSVARHLLEAGRSMYFTIKTELCFPWQVLHSEFWRRQT